MVSDYAASVQGVALRVVKLAADGTPFTGATGNGWVTNQFVSLSFTPTYSEGEEIEVKAADGTTCVYYQVPDVMKNVEIELSICAPEPELTALLVGGTLFGTQPDYVGYAAPTLGSIGTPNGVSVEVWSKAIVGGKIASINPYWWWVFPYTTWTPSGERVLENGAMANVFSGVGVGNANWGDGPLAAQPWPYTSASAYQYARAAATKVPATTGPVAVT